MILLTASSKTRAERRYNELLEKGVDCNIEDIEKDIKDRIKLAVIGLGQRGLCMLKILLFQ